MNQLKEKGLTKCKPLKSLCEKHNTITAYRRVRYDDGYVYD
jgi:hypothetical protein